jgi:class 3 adenylate cyclase
MTQTSPIRGPAAIDEPGPESPTQGEARARRSYLTRRRHEMLCPIRAIAEFAQILIAESASPDRSRMLGDLTKIRDTAIRMESIIDRVLVPDQSATEEAAKALNHDLRSLMTIIIGYGDELLRVARKAGIDHDLVELDQIRSLGRRALALVDSTVTHLRSPDAANSTDDVQRYLDRVSPPCEGVDAPEVVNPSVEPGLILVVDDSELIRDLVRNHLVEQGHEVIVAADGFEAVTLLGARSFDLILTDLEMPRLNGFQLLEHVKSDPCYRDIPVIIISGHGELDGIAYCIKRGAEDYLPKPFNRTILKARVDACLEKKRLRDRNDCQRKRFDELLHAILPGPIVLELTQTNDVRPRLHEDVAVLFADVVGFTTYCDRLQDQPELVVRHLKHFFEASEEIASGFGVQKIKTIGDAFMAAAGLLENVENPVLDCVKCGLSLIEMARGMRDCDGNPLGWDLRVGIHVGPVVAGVLGRKQSLYDLWGDTVNVAARLESHGRAGFVNLSSAAWQRVSGFYRSKDVTSCKLKGKPDPVEMIHLDPTDPCCSFIA